MIEVRAFDAEITDEADVYIGTSRGHARFKGDNDPYLFVVLPSFAFKIRLTPGNCTVLRACLDEWSPAVGDGD